MHVVQTPVIPPNQGRMNLPISGCTWNNKNALKNTVSAYTIISRVEPPTDSERCELAERLPGESSTDGALGIGSIMESSQLGIEPQRTALCLTKSARFSPIK